MSTIRDYSKETLNRLPFLESMDIASFMKAAQSLNELSLDSRYVIDMPGCSQDVLRMATDRPGAEWFEIPVNIVESLTPLGFTGSDSTRLIVSIAFKPEFRPLAATFQRVGASTDRENGFAALDVAEADEDPGAPALEDLDRDTDLDLAAALANYGAVEPGTNEPPAMATPEILGESLLTETARGLLERTLPLDINAAQAFLDACIHSSPRVRYGPRPGAKVPFHGARPGRDFTAVDCSGFVREAIWRATTPHLNFPDGSVVQHEWIRAQGFTRSSPDAALLRDGAVRIAFLRPQDAPRRPGQRTGVGHVALVHNSRTIESHGGGVGPDSRPWNKTGWQAKTFVYFLTPSAS